MGNMLYPHNIITNRKKYTQNYSCRYSFEESSLFLFGQNNIFAENQYNEFKWQCIVLFRVGTQALHISTYSVLAHFVR